MQRWKETFSPKGAKQVMEDRKSRDGRKDKAKDSTEHGAVRSDGKIREMKGATKKKKKFRNLRDGKTRNRMAMTATLTPISKPFRLIVHTRQRAAAEGKLASHS